MERINKGKSTISFPSDYTVIDIETTGLISDIFSVIEVSAIRYRNNIAVDTFSSLVNEPGCEIDDFIEELTGITRAEIDSAPPVDEVLNDYFEFIGNDILIGHNVNFDINFLYDKGLKYIGCCLSNDFVDTLRIARKLLSDLSHHRLDDLCTHFGIGLRDKHRALNDCELTNDVYNALRDSIYDKQSFIDSFIHHSKSHHKLRANEIIQTDGIEISTTNPFYNKVCVFTGALSMLRKEAMQLVVDRGGIVADGVTAKTNYLILGNNDYCKSIKDGKSSKQKKAESLILKGQDLEIIPENVFVEMLYMD